MKGRRRLTCHHEAGHALVRWYFGHRPDRAVVLTVEEVRAGKTIENRRGIEVVCEGMVDGWDIHGQPFGPPPPMRSAADTAHFLRLAEIARDIELVNCAAGIAAEAVYRRVSGFMVAIGGGDGDLRISRAIREAWFPNEAESRKAAFLAERRAAALVRSSPGSAAIRAMAAALLDRGEIDGDEIGALCRHAYGGRECRFGGWNDHWPPTLAQLRAGFIPELQEKAA